MTELRGFDLDGETSRAWRAFAGRLADHLADMEEGDSLEIGLVGLPTEAPGAASSTLRFAGGEDEVLRSEIVVARRTTAKDAQAQARVSALESTLAELGWQRIDDPHAAASAPGSGEAQPDVIRAEQVLPRREVDLLSSLSVRLLCEVLGAVHPVFLRVSGDRDLIDRAPDGHPIADVKDLDLPAVTEPRDSAHLRDLVAATIATDLGAEPPRDPDGDIVLEVGTTRVFVRVLEESPVVSVFGRLVHAVAYPYEAQAVVTRLNAEYSFVKFIYGGDAVVACVHLPAMPFVPAQLRRMIATFGELADAIDDELVMRLGGVRELEPAADDEGEQDEAEESTPYDENDPIPPELVTLLQLDPGGEGLDPEVTARICGYDRALTWQLMHIAKGQETIWRQAAQQNREDTDEEVKCVDEATGWTATRRSLAQALDLINTSHS